MKRTIIALFATISFIAASAQGPMTKQKDGTYVVNTTTLCNTKGFEGKTPVEVYIKNGKVIKVVALPNEESPNFFAKVKNVLLPSYSNMPLKKAKKQSEAVKIDGCTGATYSTKAVQQNIKAALEYYEKSVSKF